MFWRKKPQKGQKAKSPAGKGGASQAGVRAGGAGSESEALRAQAMANVRAARESIGEDTLDRMAAAMRKKQQSPLERAKAQILDEDAERVASEILAMIDDDDGKPRKR
ncbi:MAG: hypothetical protein KDJ75_05080 [Alphaproteobacteria bacterium]|nr:hypothetical protein [Alphaproteobacteria bacterium]